MGQTVYNYYNPLCVSLGLNCCGTGKGRNFCLQFIIPVTHKWHNLKAHAQALCLLQSCYQLFCDVPWAFSIKALDISIEVSGSPWLVFLGLLNKVCLSVMVTIFYKTIVFLVMIKSYKLSVDWRISLYYAVEHWLREPARVVGVIGLQVQNTGLHRLWQWFRFIIPSYWAAVKLN